MAQAAEPPPVSLGLGLEKYFLVLFSLRPEWWLRTLWQALRSRGSKVRAALTPKGWSGLARRPRPGRVGVVSHTTGRFRGGACETRTGGTAPRAGFKCNIEDS